MKTNLLGLQLDELEAMLVAWGHKAFHARQLLRWIHQRGECEFVRMSDMAQSLRARLIDEAQIPAAKVLKATCSVDGTHKWLLDVDGINAIETVFIPEARRGTLCLSSQAGCALDCAFCATGKQGLNRNLTAAQIIMQLWWAKRALGDFLHPQDKSLRKISNIVFMGMGEPLANFDELVKALHILLDDHAYGLSARRVTVSTSGLVPKMDRLREACPVSLAVSLHAPSDALRDQLVPINKNYPLRELMAACQRYLNDSPRRVITFEYVMLAGVNDADTHASQLVQLVRDIPCKFNLIPFNPFPGTQFVASSPQRIERFAAVLQAADQIVTVRKTRGDDIDAACGQLAGQVVDLTRRAQRYVQTTKSSAIQGGV
jgi:23S rRNA (adenine2503-C2)-methyltransferase